MYYSQGFSFIEVCVCVCVGVLGIWYMIAHSLTHILLFTLKRSHERSRK